MSKRNGNLNWNTARHDATVADRKKHDYEAAIQKGRLRAYASLQEGFKTLQKTLMREAKKDGGVSLSRVVQALYELQGRADKTLRNIAGVDDLRRDTAKMIENVVSAVIATEGGVKNQIIEFIAPTLREDAHALAVPEAAVFETLEELAAVKFVAPFTRREGFVGLIRNGLWVKAFFKPVPPMNQVELATVGLCVCSTAIKALPTEDQLRAEFGGKEEGK